MTLLPMSDLNPSGKRVMIREDLNVRVQNGQVTSDMRIRAALPTLRSAMRQGACVIVLSHLGRPEEGKYDPAMSLSPVTTKLSELLGSGGYWRRCGCSTGFSRTRRVTWGN
jgi:phosphoglycerate kinase